MAHLFIAMEGVNGCGKTTLCKRVAEELGAEYIKSPTGVFLPIREAIDRTASLEARFYYYMAANLQIAADVGKILQERPVVLDRYVLTTIAFHRVAGAKIIPSDGTLLQILWPDFYFLVTCEEQERKRRLQDRGMDFNDERADRWNVEQRMLEIFKGYGLTEIDATQRDPEIAVRQVLSLVRG